jgi:hypothetical protein
MATSCRVVLVVTALLMPLPLAGSATQEPGSVTVSATTPPVVALHASQPGGRAYFPAMLSWAGQTLVLGVNTQSDNLHDSGMRGRSLGSTDGGAHWTELAQSLAPWQLEVCCLPVVPDKKTYLAFSYGLRRESPHAPSRAYAHAVVLQLASAHDGAGVPPAKQVAERNVTFNFSDPALQPAVYRPIGCPQSPDSSCNKSSDLAQPTESFAFANTGNIIHPAKGQHPQRLLTSVYGVFEKDWPAPTAAAAPAPQYPPSHNYSIAIFGSADGGQHWDYLATAAGRSAPASAVHYAGVCVIGASENHMVRLHDGSLFLVHRVSDDGYDLCFTTSDTAGKEWSYSRPLRSTGPKQPWGVAPRLLLLPDINVLALTTGRPGLMMWTTSAVSSASAAGASEFQGWNLGAEHNKLVQGAPKFLSNCSKYGEKGCILPGGSDVPGRAGLGSTTSYTGLAKGKQDCARGACTVLVSYDWLANGWQPVPAGQSNLIFVMQLTIQNGSQDTVHERQGSQLKHDDDDDDTKSPRPVDGVWTMPGDRVPLGFYGYNMADPPCDLLRNSSQPQPANCPDGAPVGWGSNEAFWHDYSAAGFNTFVYEYQTRDGFSQGLDYLHRQLALPIWPILGLQNNAEFANACQGKMMAPPNRSAALIEARALAARFKGDARIFGYETLDEPSGSADWATQLYHTMKAEDPARPVLLNLGCDGWAPLNVTGPLVQASDVATIDPYVDYTKSPSADWQAQDPFNSNSVRTVAKAMDYLKTTIAAGSRAGGNKPRQVLAVLASLRSNADPQGQWNATFRYATKSEVRAEAFVAVNHGAQGILYWPGVSHTFRTVAPGLWEGLVEVAQDVQSLAPMVLTPLRSTDALPVIASAQAVDLGVKTVSINGSTYLYLTAVNTDTLATACAFDVSMLQDVIAITTPVEVVLPRVLPQGQARNISLDGKHSAAAPSSGGFAYTWRAERMDALEVYVYRIKLATHSRHKTDDGALVAAKPQLLLSCSADNDLFVHLPPALNASRHATAEAAITAAQSGDTVLLLADGYPTAPTAIAPELFALAKSKHLRVFVEFPKAVPEPVTLGSEVNAGNMSFQRLVVTTDEFAGLARNRILYGHGAQWLQAGPWAGHHSSASACKNGSMSRVGSTVEATVKGSWPELVCRACQVRYSGTLCDQNGTIIWNSVENMNNNQKWSRSSVDSVQKWFGFCGISPTGMTLPERLCQGSASSSNASGAYCSTCPPAPVPVVPPASAIQPLLVSARVAGYDVASFGLNGTDSSPILFRHPQQEDLIIATTKLSSFVRGRFAPVQAWKLLWKSLLGSLAPWAGTVELEWEAAVHPAFGADSALPTNAELQASMTGVEWLRGRSGLLPGPKQLSRISQFLDPRWVDTDSALSNCSYGECKAPLWVPNGIEERGDGRGGILEGYTNLIQSDGSQYQVLQFRADCTCESAMAFASYSHAQTLASPVSGNQLDDTDAVASRLLDHAFTVGGLQEGSSIKGAEADGATGFLHWTMGGSDAPGVTSLWGDDNARAILGAMSAAAMLNKTRWSTQIARAILGNLRAVGVDGFRPVSMSTGQLTGKVVSKYGSVNFSGWQQYHSANWSAIEGDSYKDWAFSPHMESYIWAVFLKAYALTGDEAFYERAFLPIQAMMNAFPGWAPIANGVQLQKARMLLPLSWLVRVADTPLHREWLSRVADDLLASQQPCGAIREEICAPGWRCTDTSNTPQSNQAYGHGEAPLQQTNTDPVTDALYTVNFAALGLREAVAATGNATLAAAEAKLAGYLTRIQQRSQLRPELDGAWMRAFDYDKWEVWASASDIGWGPWCIETGWMNSWIITMLSFKARNASVWETTATGAVATSLGDELRAWKPYFFPSLKTDEHLELFNKLGANSASISNAADLIVQLVMNETMRTEDPRLLETVRRQAAHRIAAEQKAGPSYAGLKTDDNLPIRATRKDWQPTAKLNSVFVSLQAGRSVGEWTPARWSTLVDDLKAIQVENVVLADCVTEQEAWYPSKIPGLTYGGTDVVDQALTAAAAGGLSVYLGLLLPANWFHEGAMNASYLTALGRREDAVARELHELYGRTTSLQGFYQPAELYSTCCYSHTRRCDTAHITRLAQMLEPTGQLIHTLRPSYQYVIAPFAANVSQAETAWWRELLSQTPSIDILALQDGVGVAAGKRSPKQASDLIAAVSMAAREQNVSMWTDIEIFTHPAYTVGPTGESPKPETCVCLPLTDCWCRTGLRPNQVGGTVRLRNDDMGVHLLYGSPRVLFEESC